MPFLIKLQLSQFLRLLLELMVDIEFEEGRQQLVQGSLIEQ